MINKIYNFFFEEPYFSTKAKSSVKERWEEEFRKAESGGDRLERFFSMKSAELIVHQLINEYEDEYGADVVMNQFNQVNADGPVTTQNFVSNVDIARYGFRNFVSNYIVPAIAEKEEVSDAQAAKKVREDLGQAYMNLVENIRRDANMEEMKERAPEVPSDITENAADIAQAAKESGNVIMDLDEVDAEDFVDTSSKQSE